MKLKTKALRSRGYSQRARAEAAEANGQRIIEAFLARLMTQWFDEITLDRVAKDAGVTVQTVVRRFGGKEGLLAGSLATLGGRIRATRAMPQGELDRLVENLVADYEQTGETVMRFLALEERHPSLKKFTDFGRSEHRKWVASAFEETISGASDEARKRAIDALVILTDVYSWKLLRRDMGRSILEARATLTHMIRSFLAAIDK